MSVQNKAGPFRLDSEGLLASPDVQNSHHRTIYKWVCVEISDALEVAVAILSFKFPQYPCYFKFYYFKRNYRA